MNNLIRKLSIFIILNSLFFSSSNITNAEENIGIVRGSYVNLRSEPKFNSNIVGKKLRGDVYTIEYEKDNWLKVIFKDNTQGWIYRTLIEDNRKPSKNTEISTINASDSVQVNKESSTNITTGTNEKENTKVDKKQGKKESEKNSKKSTSKEIKDSNNYDKPLIKEVKKDKISEVVEIAGTAEELYNEAIKLYEERKYFEALEKNILASKKAPKNAEILNNLGNCQFKLGRYEEALETWKEALKIAPRSGKICNNLGIAYYQLDKNNDAIEYYKKAIIFEPDFSDPYYNIASVYGFTGEFEEAVKNYKKFLEFNPDDTMKKLADERLSYCQKQLSNKQ